jgi:hypothetical protein
MTSAPKRTAELLTVVRGNDDAIGGHIAFRIDETVYNFLPDREILDNPILRLDIQRFETFKLYYNIVQERDVIGLELDLSDSKIQLLEQEFLTLKKLQDNQLYFRYKLFKTNCVAPIRVALNRVNPERFIDDPILSLSNAPFLYPSRIPYFFARQVMERYPIHEKRLYLSRRHTLRDPLDIKEYFPFLSEISPPQASWRFISAEDLTGGLTLLRPVSGSLNMATGAVQTLYGIPSSIVGKHDLKYGFRGVVKSLPELFLFNVRFPVGRSLPYRDIYHEQDRDIPYLNYSLPDLDFLIEQKGDNTFHLLFQNLNNNDVEISDIIQRVEEADKLSKAIQKGGLSQNKKIEFIKKRHDSLNDYYRDSFLKILTLKDKRWIFHKNRTLNIESLKKFLRQNRANNRGQGIRVMNLEFNAPRPEVDSIQYINFASTPSQPSSNGEHALDMALIVKRYAPDAQITIASYIHPVKDMEQAVDYAISHEFDIILHPEAHPNLGAIDSIYVPESAPVNQLAKRAYESGILWINSAGNFRDKFRLLIFKQLDEVQQFHIHVDSEKIVKLYFNWGDWRDPQQDDTFLLLIENNRGLLFKKEVLDAESIRSVTLNPVEKGAYRVVIRPVAFAKRYYDAHRLFVFATAQITPSSSNLASVASPANSPYVVTVGASNKHKPVSYSSTSAILPLYEDLGDDIEKAWDKPDFYAPVPIKHPRNPLNSFENTSASSAYVAAFFAVLLSNQKTQSDSKTVIKTTSSNIK